MNPLLFIDLETTGLSPAIHAPISVGALILGGEHSGKHFQAWLRPFDGAIIDAFALQVNGYKYEQIMKFPPSLDVFQNFKDWLCITHPEPFLISPVGHNVKFDEGFMREWWIRHTDSTLYGHLFAPPVCTINVIKQTWPDHNRGAWPKKGGHKLTFQYEYHFGQSYAGAHTELADCYATRSIFLHADKVSGRNEWKEFHHLIPEFPVNTLS